MNSSVCAVVVTRNRSALLRLCLAGLLGQSRKPDRVIVVDNASSDDTPSLFDSGAINGLAMIDYVRIDANTGGAGGFHVGITRAVAQGFDWIWVMDDDAYPEPGALAALLSVGPELLAIHAAVAVSDSGDPGELVWPAAVMEGKDRGALRLCVDELKAPVVAVLNAPFIGMLLNRKLIERIGLPDRSFFVSSDDAEMCARAWKSAAGVRLVPAAVVRHPPILRRWLRLWRWRVSVMELAPWRRYYDTRNRLVLAKRHCGRGLWTEALPGTLARWLVTLVVQRDRLAQSRAFALGIADGLTERLGMRWPPP